MPLSVGTGASGAYIGYAADTPKSKSDIQDTLTRLERQRNDIERQQEENASAANDKKIKDLENRINNLRTRMDKMKSEDDGECQTCENRRYQDGSNDPGVSFKSASKISGNVEAAVRGHEQEHVSRNRAKADREGREIVYQSVVIKHAICPECGKTYVAGGETTTVTRSKPPEEEIDFSAEKSEKTGKTEDAEKTDVKDPVSGNSVGTTSRRDNDQNEDFAANAPEERQPKQDERFNVGMYDREREIGRFLNIVA